MKKILMLTAAVFTLQALPAMAEEGAKKHPRGEKFFEMQDTNKDGVISEEEFVSHAKKRFEAMDANKDGNVTKEEAKAHHEAKKAKWKEKRGEKKGGDVPPPVEAPPAE